MIPDELDITLPQLRCFVAVVEAGSLAEAGRRMGLSAASVSKTIARLEEAAGVRLLHRSTHGFSLTAEGEELIGPAREVLGAAAGFREIAGGRAGDAAGGVVRISVPVAFCRVVLAPLLAAFCREHPDIRVDVRASNEIVSLADDGVDIALRSGPLDRVPGHVQQRWFAFPWVFCAAPDYLARRGTPATIEELRAHALIGFRNQRTGQIQGWPYRTPGGTAARLAPDPSLIFDDGDSGWQAVLAGGGIACTPLWLGAPALRDGRALEVLREARDEAVAMSIVRRERRLTPARVTTLIDYLIANAPLLDDL